MFCQVLLYSKVNQPYIYTYLVFFGFPCHLKRCWENWTAVWKRLESEHSLTGAVSGQSPACQCRRRKRRGFNPWIRKIPWRRTWQSTPVYLPGVPHGWRCLVGYSPWGPKASNMTEVNERTCSQTSQRQRQTSSQWMLLLATHLSDNIRDAMCCRKPSWHLSMGGLLSELTCGFLDSLSDFWTPEFLKSFLNFKSVDLLHGRHQHSPSLFGTGYQWPGRSFFSPQNGRGLFHGDPSTLHLLRTLFLLLLHQFHCRSSGILDPRGEGRLIYIIRLTMPADLAQWPRICILNKRPADIDTVDPETVFWEALVE